MQQDHAKLAEHLPFLRRYARVLSGSQDAGDTAVIAAIRAHEVATSPSSGGASKAGTLDHALAVEADAFGTFAFAPLEPGTRQGSSREQLYRAFTQIWNGPVGEHIRAIAVSDADASDVERRLAAIPLLARQAFLLSVIENFDDAAIGRILDLDATALPLLKAEVKTSITRQVATEVLIIEDELFIAADLGHTMQSLGHDVIAIERTHASAVRAIEYRKPGLIIADIQLADGSSGLDAVNEILKQCEVPVVFITAYPERLLTGRRPEPSFILTKPFRTDSLCAVVSQALLFGTNARRSRAATGANAAPMRRAR